MSAILGISAYYHDSAAALVVDGQIIAAAQEERFSRRKNDASFPQQAIEYCLRQSNLEIEQLDFVGFYEKPLVKFERLIETHLANAPWSYRSFRRAIPTWVTEKLRLNRELRQGLGNRYSKRFVYCDHHQSHAASAFYPSPFDEAAILTVDGVGEWSTACFGVGRNNKITLNHETRFPHSLGLLYSAFTEFLGFRVNEGEYKVMGLAPYGQPKYVDLIFEKLLDLNDDGSFRLDMNYFNYCRGLTMTNRNFHRLFQRSPRTSGQEISQQEMDIAASVQKVTEKILMRMVDHIHQNTGMRNLVLAGGVALNSVANGLIARDGPFEKIWIQPAAGDSGGALGTALLIQYELLGHERANIETDGQQGSFLGPEYDDTQIQCLLKDEGAAFQKFESDQSLCDSVAQHLAEKKTVGWFQGRMEFGPRALGGRSILADPRDESMKSRLNETVKHRESFRPFAPVALSECAAEHFDIPSNSAEHPYMQLVVPVKPDAEHSLSAVTHVDRSVRLQTADLKRHPLLRKLLKSFQSKSGCPALVNTSFNVRGEPLVCRPQDALRCFLATDLDVLVMGRYLLLQEDQTSAARQAAGLELSKQIKRNEESSPGQIASQQLWHPSSRQLSRFGFSFLLGLPIAGWLVGGNLLTIILLAIVGVVIALIGCVVPKILKPAYLLATIPIAVVFGELGLLCIYFGIVLPMGLFFALIGRDSLQCRRTHDAKKTFWRSKSQPADLESYFRQS